MKRILALLLATVLLFSLASCSQKKSDHPNKNAYTLSESAKEGSVVDGVMTDISGADPILEKTTAAWLDKCVLYEVNIRQFTEEGTFKAFEEHLDRLKAMGVNTLWLMPIHPISEKERKGTLGSYYAVSDYKDVNPEFGTMDDFKHLLNKAHDMGFKVILDWVANHTGWDNKWITEHEDWYVHDKNGEIEYPYDWSDVAQLDYENYEMRAEMIKCMQYWVEDIGVDGFRCDHAIGVPAPFWNAAVYKLKSINSDLLMLAESSAAQSLTTYAFDSCYNDALYGQAVMTKGGVATTTIKNGMEVNGNFAEGSFPMNYLDNHDKNSYEESAVERFKDTYQTLLTLCFISPGMPLLYTTDEQEYDHAIEFFEKDSVKWKDDPEYAPLITALSKIKQDNAALDSTNRDISFIDADNVNAFAFSRSSGDNTVIYLSNLYYDPLENVTISFDFDKATCVLHNDGETLDTEQKDMTAADFEHMTLKPYEYYVLVVK